MQKAEPPVEAAPVVAAPVVVKPEPAPVVVKPEPAPVDAKPEPAPVIEKSEPVVAAPIVQKVEPPPPVPIVEKVDQPRPVLQQAPVIAEAPRSAPVVEKREEPKAAESFPPPASFSAPASAPSLPVRVPIAPSVPAPFEIQSKPVSRPLFEMPPPSQYVPPPFQVNIYLSIFIEINLSSFMCNNLCVEAKKRKFI
jgi:periplasmic protein TonB